MRARESEPAAPSNVAEIEGVPGVRLVSAAARLAAAPSNVAEIGGGGAAWPSSSVRVTTPEPLPSAHSFQAAPLSGVQ